MEKAPPSICILDDEPSIRRSIERLLASDGLAALSFARAEDFLAHAREHEVKVAVLDVRLVEGDGLQVQNELRQVSPQTRVIVMTGQQRPEVERQALTQGASAFLRKPFEDEEFLTQIRRALER